MTATYWEIGRRIVEFEQGGKERAEYGEALLLKLSRTLQLAMDKGFLRTTSRPCANFYVQFLRDEFPRQHLGKSYDNERHCRSNRMSEIDCCSEMADYHDLRPCSCISLPWSSYVQLVRNSRSPEALDFYHTEALRGGWTVRQLKRQIDSQFYERTALSRDKVAMLEKGANHNPATRSLRTRKSKTRSCSNFSA